MTTIVSSPSNSASGCPDRAATARYLLQIGVAVAILVAMACGGGDAMSPTPTSGAEYSQTDLVIGTGTRAVAGSVATVSYAGWFYDAHPATRSRVWQFWIRQHSPAREPRVRDFAAERAVVVIQTADMSRGPHIAGGI